MITLDNFISAGFTQVSETKAETEIIIRVTADPNDADYETKDTKYSANMAADKFSALLEMLKVLKKLCCTDGFEVSHLDDRFNRLADSEVDILHKFDCLFGVLQPDREDYTIMNAGEPFRDSPIRDLFPNDSDWACENCDCLNHCHTLVSVELFYTDDSGKTVELNIP